MMSGMGGPVVDPEAGPAPVVAGTAEADHDGDFDALYRREYAPMLRLAYLLLGSNELAEEAVHDAFAKVFERWSRIDRPGAYLRTCVVNRCRDLQRRRRFERTSRDRPPTEQDLGADEVLDALAALPHRQRAALVLRYYEDLSEAEIADALGVRPGTVKSLVSRGLDRLREVIER
jgi:RNA polymerase sigma-70 factor (sigma-E family)